MDVNALYIAMFWASLTFLTVGTVMGLSAVWIPQLFDNDWGWKLLISDAILFGVAVAGALITKLLR